MREAAFLDFAEFLGSLVREGLLPKGQAAPLLWEDAVLQLAPAQNTPKDSITVPGHFCVK